MTLQEAKDQTAVKYGYSHWEHMTPFLLGYEYKQLSKRHDEAAELYASAKWDEACRLQRRSCYRAYMDQPIVMAANKHEGISKEMEAIENAQKPEFK